MPNYRRAYVAGGCWFFTVNLHDRQQKLLTEHVDALRDAVAATRQSFPFVVDAMIVLPDHMHAILSPPPGDADFSTRWRMIKTRFSKPLPARERLDTTRQARGERGIWQRRFWEHLIRDDADYARHVDYCYINPVKHGLVSRVQDWPHSSFHRDVQRGILPIDWAGDVNAVGEFGEAS
ncbi:MAG TPA: transposase [Xanthobacteraceae bacterium]|nr:transposase [Xanthobacteraceae bacterium]